MTHVIDCLISCRFCTISTVKLVLGDARYKWVQYFSFECREVRGIHVKCIKS